MEFPAWVDKHKDSKDRARARLQFMLYDVANRVVGRPSLSALAKKCKVDRTSLSCALKRGHLTKPMAVKISGALGKGVLPVDHLLNPLNVGTTVK